MKLLVTSDLHLSDRIWRHRPIEGDSYYAWQQIVAMAQEHRVDGVILAGDVLDKQANLATPIQALAHGLAELADAGIKVFYTQGQHEYQEQPWAALSPSAVWLHQNRIKTRENWLILGNDYQNEEQLQKFLKHPSTATADILVCHQVWLDYMGETGKPQGSFADLPPEVRYLITGDYHVHRQDQFGTLTVLSPGSTHLRSISEPVDKFVFLMELGAHDQPAQITSLPLRGRRVIAISAEDVPDFKKLKEQVQTRVDEAIEYADEYELPVALMKPLIRLTHRKDQPELVRQFQKTFAETGHLFYKQCRTATADDEPEILDHIDAGDRIGMLNCLDHYLDPQKQELTYALALSLLQSPDPEQALHRWIQEQLHAAPV